MSKVLQTPSVNSIVPFDPLYDYTVNFIYNDNQSKIGLLLPIIQRMKFYMTQHRKRCDCNMLFLQTH